jgi:predicted RNA-binding Zn ribbon-like protein
MADRSPQFTGVTLALELANTIDMLEDPPDFLRDLERLQRFLRHVGNDAAEEPLTQAHLGALRDLRDQLTRAMDSDEKRAAPLLGELAGTFDLRPRLVQSGDRGWNIQLGPAPTEGLEGLGASAVVGLMELLAMGRWDRIGRCAGAPCCCLFVDRTKNRNRRFCCQLCADRINQANTRTRSRQ